MSTKAAINTEDLPDTSAENIDFMRKNAKRLAFLDIKQGLQQWRIWTMLAYQDIKLRYRRSILGPFWITLSMAITVYSMGLLYSHLFHSDLKTYFPFLVGGMLSWALISGVIVELIDTFPSSEGMIKQIKLPYSLYIHRVATRHIFIFFHNILVIVPILIIFHEVAKVNLNTLLLIPALAIIYINSISYGLVLAIIGARFRDVSQILKSLIQVIFFLTPIMWSPAALPPGKTFVVAFNPFSAFVELVRAPLIGMTPSGHDLLMVLGITLIGIGLCYKMFTRYRARIVYWV